MRRYVLIAVILVMAFPVSVFAQAQQQNKEPLLIQLYEDVLKSRQNTEIELGACKIQVKDIQRQLQAATETKEKK